MSDARIDEPEVIPLASPALPIVPQPTPGSRNDLIQLLVAAGWGVTQIRDVLKGTNREIGALVHQIEDTQLYQRSAE